MNHADIEERQIAERYVRGQLSPEESESFEEHYLSCQECLDRLELAESMDRGFKRAVAEDAAKAVAVRQLALVAWLARLGRSRQLAALVMAVFVVALVPGLFALREMRVRDRQLTAVQAAEEKAREAAGLRRELEASRRDLVRAQEAGAAAERDLAAAREPQGNVPILFLDAERGSAQGEPTHSVRLPTSGSIVLGLMIDGSHQADYRVTVRNSGGREVWHGDGLRVSDSDTISLSLPSNLLMPGDYTLTVDGLPPGGKPVAAGRFVFRVLG
jgi:anti-sigma factor RsiW